ncbi:MAG: Antibiotic biosynthesis monooxygenase [Bradyrhizobium sp.]|nr:Antibiotic biosynthesis monooxygenase [Bradyrhizobium sp.]
MGVNIITQFRVKHGRADDLVALIRSLVAESLEHDGCEKISIRQNQDDPEDVISAQRWASRQHYLDYVAWRTENGVTAQFEDLLASPIGVRFFNDVEM